MFLTETEKQTHNENMGTSRDFHDNSWRIISSILIVCWVITILYNHTKGTLNLVLVPAIISVGLSIYSIINPRKLLPFGLLATFWGLMYIYISGKIPGFLLFMLGISFDIKSGFFKKFVIPKIIFLFSCLVFVLYHVYKMDPEILFDTMLDSIVVILIVVMINLTYGDLRLPIPKDKENKLTTIFNTQELSYIKLLIQDYKYFSIAQTFNVSESSVKRMFANIYAKLNVKTRNEFLEEIKQMATLEEMQFLELE